MMRTKKTMISALLSAIVFAGIIRCVNTPSNSSAGTATGTENVSAHMQFVRSDIPRNLSPNVTSEELDSLVRSNTRFAFDLYKQLRLSGGNVVFSPYSVSQAVAMAYAGARNETARQIAAAMRFTLPDSIIHAGFDSVDLSLSRWSVFMNDTAYTLRNANSIWVQESLSVQKNYLDLLSSYYNTGLYTVDFIKGHDSSAIAVNNWMSAMTARRINDCIPSKSLDSHTRLVLVNALYFKSMWNDTFSVADTRDSAFVNLDSSNSAVPYMHSKLMHFNYYFETDGYQAVELLLAGWRTSMVIIMPKPGHFNTMEQEFTFDTLEDIFSQFKLNSVLLTVSMPKFSLETGVYDLKPVLSNLGMPQAFAFGQADFSGIDGQKANLYIGSANHEGFISINEWGIEAAAATVVQIVPSGMEPVKAISIDHPFLFFIRDRMTNTILYMGRIIKL